MVQVFGRCRCIGTSVPVLQHGNRELLINALCSVHPKYALLWRIGQDTGLRISDTLKLTPKMVSYAPFAVVEKKTGKTKVCELSQDVMAAVDYHVKRYRLKPNDYLIFSRECVRSRPLSRQQAHSVLRRVALQNGLCDVSPHSMRKTYAANYFASTGDVEGLQRDLNHKYIATTLLYLYNPKYGRNPI